MSGNVWISNYSQGDVLRQLQGKLVPKLTLGPFLALSVRNGPNPESYLS